MRKFEFVILGSGIGGLAAGAELKRKGKDDFIILERSVCLPLNFKNGLHGLHTDRLNFPFPIQLKKIVTTETVWNPRKDEFKSRANLPDMIDYSLKVMNLRHPSSIMDAGNDPWQFYVPESNDMDDIPRGYGGYLGLSSFSFDSQISRIDLKNKIVEVNGEEEFGYEKLITTIPMNLFYELTGLSAQERFGVKLINRPLIITNYSALRIVPNWLIVIYISDEQFKTYRITVMNGLLSMESLFHLTPEDEAIIQYHLSRYFEYQLSSKIEYVWDGGRIWGLNRETRELIKQSLNIYGVYPVGRFACWDGKLRIDSTIEQANEVIEGILSRSVL
jgi:hypothetical protein